MAYDISARVALARDIPEYKLCKGDVATVVEEHEEEEPRYSVEVFNGLGDSVAVLRVAESEIEPLRKDEILHVRHFETVDPEEEERAKRKREYIERYAFGIKADSEEMPKIFSHSDRFLIIDMKDRKEIIHEEYRPNPYGKICRTKYPMPACLGDRISDEEREIYKNMAEIIKDCDTTIGNNLGYFPKMALEKVTFYVMQSVPVMPRDHIKELFEIRAFYGDKWHDRG